MSKKFQETIQAGEIENEAPESKVEVKTGFFSGPGVTNKPVEYVVSNGIALCEGCVELGTAEEVERETAAIRASQQASASDNGIPAEADAGSSSDVVLQGVGLPRNSAYLWTNGVMPYVINSNLPNQNRVTQAIQHWTINTGMRLVQRTAANAASYPNYVEFVRNPNANWSSSRIGMRGGRQLIRVSDAASAGTVIHEIGHAFGHYHEQSRSDRDSYVTINWQNITPGFESNFQKRLSATDYYEYDYDSIMHYPTWAFSTNGQPTIVPLQSGVTIGQRSALSFGDRLSNAKMYERFFKKGHTGVWKQANGRYGLWVNASWSSFRNKWQQWAAQGLRLTDLNVHHRFGSTRYSGVWMPGSGGYGLWANASWSSFHAKWQEWSRRGLRLVDMNVHHVNGQNRYSGVWLPGRGGYGLWVNASWSSFVAKWREWSRRGLRLVDINVHTVNGRNRYSGVWLPGRGGYGLWANVTWSSFVAKWREWSRQGLRLVDMNVHRVNGQNRYSGVFMSGGGGYYLWANVTWQNFRAKWQQLGQKGLRLIDYEFIHTGSGPSYDVSASAPKLQDADFDAAFDNETEDGYGGIFGEDEIAANGEKTQVEAAVEAEQFIEADAITEDGADEAFGGFVEGVQESADAETAAAEESQGGIVMAESEKTEPESQDESGGAVFDAETSAEQSDEDEGNGFAVLEPTPETANHKEPVPA